MTIVPIVIKASVLLAAALGGARALRGAPAAARHALWSVTFAALIALPALDAAVPAVYVPVPDGWARARAVGGASEPPIGATRTSARTDADATTGAAGLAARAPATRSSAAVRPVTAAGATVSIGTMAWLIWLTGAVAAAGALLLSLWRVHRLIRTASVIADPAWHDAVAAIGARLALRRTARVLVSDAVRTPMAAGAWRPVVFVPAGATAWTAERRDVVLAHELSHIAGRDPLRHLAARLAVAGYWFHPLAWLAARQSSLAREQACDDAVLALGIRPSAYAQVLLDLAETMAPPRRAAAALPMVERSLLETRLMAILDDRTRPPRPRHHFVPAVGAAMLAAALAAAQPVARDLTVRTPAVAAAASLAASARVPDAAVTAIADPQVRQGVDGTCWSGRSEQSITSFTTRVGERVTTFGGVITGTSSAAGDWLIQQRFGDLRVCMAALGGTLGSGDGPSAWAGRAPHVIIETARSGETAHFETRQASPAQTIWRVNGADRPFDASAQAWRDAVLAVLDRSWEVSALRGQASTLRGDISSLRGEESSLRGQISSVRGEVSSLRGQQSSIRGDESSLRGEIATIEGQVSSLRGQISSERGSISSLQASRYDLGDAERARLTAQLASHEDEIARLEQELRNFNEASKIAAVEKQIRALDAAGKIAAVEAQIRTVDEAGKIEAIEKQIQALDVAGKTADIERRIQALDVDRRSREIQGRLDTDLRHLQQALASLK
jgi:beta-lactamase regulating signal transducer with metallopeptidase domain